MQKYSIVVCSYRIEETLARTRKEAVGKIYERLRLGESLVPEDAVSMAVIESLAKAGGKNAIR